MTFEDGSTLHDEVDRGHVRAPRRGQQRMGEWTKTDEEIILEINFDGFLCHTLD
jgi:hypothetical protein